MYTTRTSRHVGAPPTAVYRALLDPEAVARWRVPDGMSARVHEFDARVGGAFRVTLTYDAPGAAGKTGARGDTYHGRFTELVPGEKVVEELEFETEDSGFGGTMTMTTTLAPAGTGTQILVVHEGVPDGVSPADNETGTLMALGRLAALVEAGGGPWS